MAISMTSFIECSLPLCLSVFFFPISFKDLRSPINVEWCHLNIWIWLYLPYFPLKYYSTELRISPCTFWELKEYSLLLSTASLCVYSFFHVIPKIIKGCRDRVINWICSEAFHYMGRHWSSNDQNIKMVMLRAKNWLVRSTWSSPLRGRLL